MPFDISATHECVIHKKRTLQLRHWERFKYTKLREQIRDLFQLAPSAPFVLTYWRRNSGSTVAIANDDELANAQLGIDKLGSGPLPVKVMQKCSPPYLKVAYRQTQHLLDFSQSQPEFCYNQLHGRVRNLFRLPDSVEFAFTYKERDFRGPHMTVANDEILKYALEKESPKYLQLNISIVEEGTANDISGSSGQIPQPTNSSASQKTSYVVKVSHNGTLHRLTLCSDEFQFSYEKFRSRFRGHFRLPPSTSFVLTYIDEDQDEITIVEDEDLRDALVLQSLHPLKVNMVIIEANSDINQNPPIAQKEADSDT